MPPFSEELRALHSLLSRSAAAVVRLFFGSRPLAVFGCVSAIVVLPFDGELCASFGVLTNRSFSHVREEVFKFEPSATHPNPPLSVVRVSGVIRVVTTTDHRFPHSVFGKVRPTVRDHVCPIAIGCDVDLKTTARLSVAGCNLASGHDDFLSTLTSASPPSSIFFDDLFQSEEYEAPEFLIYKRELVHGIFS